MAYKKQNSTIEKLQNENIKALYGKECKVCDDILKLWNSTKIELKKQIGFFYGLNSIWDLTTPATNQAIFAIQNNMSNLLSDFRNKAVATISDKIKSHYNEQYVRQAWLLDSVTPEGVKPILKKENDLTEAEKPKEDYAKKSDWALRLGTHLEGFFNSVSQGLKQSAMNLGDLTSAISSVDNAKVNGLDIADIFSRFFSQLMIITGAIAIQDFNEQNSYFIEKMIWTTVGDDRTCEQCEPMNGREREEVIMSGEGDIPMHPNCRCVWTIIPVSFLELAEKYNVDVYDMMKAKGYSPDTIVAIDSKGEPIAEVTINFDKWQSENDGLIRSGGFNIVVE